MRPLSYATTLVALAVAVTATTCAVSQAQGQPTPPVSADAGLPADIVPGSPLADVVKMLQAGVDAATIKGYILNCQSPFNLDADKIVYLRDLGASSDLVNAMMDRDKALSAASVTPASPPAPVAAPAPMATPVAMAAPVAPDAPMAPPPTDVTVDYFNGTLTPYGSWVDVDGYGRCWRPTVAIYNVAWSPYCDNGHWVYTDYGWYWDSDYGWGVTFHYGRWFRSARFGWCWYPDTVWAPSWVAWRSGGDYCGWAPLPPFAVFSPGVGFLYRGVAVSVNFDFGLAADCFVFVSPDHFCDRRPRSFCVPRERVTEVFHQTTIINNYNVNNRTIVNRGFGVDRIASAMHRPIEPVHVSSIANAGRQGWRGEGFEKTLRPVSATRSTDNPAHATVGANNNAGRDNFTGNTGSGHELNAGANRQLHGVTTTENTRLGTADSQHHGTSVQNGTGGQGLPQNTRPTENYRSSAPAGQSVTANHGESQNFVRQPQQQQQQQTRSTTTGSSPATSQNQFQNHNPGTAGGAASQVHGATQLQQRQYNAPEQSHPNTGQAQEHNVTPPSQGNPPGQGQGQGRNPGNGGNNGANNVNNKNNPNNPNKPNQ